MFADKLTPDRRLEGEPMQIKVEPGPYQVSVARPVPYHWIDSAKKVMQEAVAAGIVTKVKEAVEWLAPAHMVETGSTWQTQAGDRFPEVIRQSCQGHALLSKWQGHVADRAS